VFGNSDRDRDLRRTRETLSFISTATVEPTRPRNSRYPGRRAYFYPFLYSDEEFPTRQFIHAAICVPTASCRHGRGIFSMRRADPTFNVLSGMTHGIRGNFPTATAKHGTQHPLDTLQTGSGTAATTRVHVQALRPARHPARFVSGYLFIPGDRRTVMSAAVPHMPGFRFYLPSAGWIEFDPTNGIVGTRDLVRVAVGAHRARRYRCTHLSRLG